MPGSGDSSVSAAHGGFDAAAQTIVEAHGLQVIDRNAGDSGARRGVLQRVGFVFDVNLLRIGVEKEPAVLQRADDVGGARIAAGGEIGDRLVCVGIIVGGEAGERVFKRLRLGRAREPAADAKDEKQQADDVAQGAWTKAGLRA